MKHMTEVALEVLAATYPIALHIGGIERLAELAGARMESRNVGGWWNLLLTDAGLVRHEYKEWHGGVWTHHYALTPAAYQIMRDGRDAEPDNQFFAV